MDIYIRIITSSSLAVTPLLIKDNQITLNKLKIKAIMRIIPESLKHRFFYFQFVVLSDVTLLGQ